MLNAQLSCERKSPVEGVLSPKKERDELFDRHIYYLIRVVIWCYCLQITIYPFNTRTSNTRRSSFTICIQPVTSASSLSAFPYRVKALRAKCRPPKKMNYTSLSFATLLSGPLLLPLKSLSDLAYIEGPNTFIYRASPYLSARKLHGIYLKTVHLNELILLLLLPHHLLSHTTFTHPSLS